MKQRLKWLIPDKILYLDLSHLRLNDFAFFTSLIDKAKIEIASRPKYSICTITNIEQAEYSSSIERIMMNFAALNKWYVKHAVVITRNLDQRELTKKVAKITEREFLFAETVEEALKYIHENCSDGAPKNPEDGA